MSGSIRILDQGRSRMFSLSKTCLASLSLYGIFLRRGEELRHSIPPALPAIPGPSCIFLREPSKIENAMHFLGEGLTREDDVFL